MDMLLYKCIKFCMICSLTCNVACSLPIYSSSEKPDITQTQEIEIYMKDFMSLYMSEACGGKQRLFMKSKDIYTTDFDSPIELTVYTNDKEENVRYKVEIYGETGKSITDYYLCENFIYVNQEREYYSSQILMNNYDDILYRRTSDWLIIEDKVYILQDNGEMKEDAEYSFFPIEEVNDWVKELEEAP